ncbi:hypothetical protein [Streptomyces vietnamensis]|uniref:Uncharacterized protein n=1 Tax=Streptomyces vietnamensis TaxID=362257 RepID=A0A0B5I0Y6_9ACTN|nr:hypothetical protein [Streptomyces vietnamensis]AJF63313.1 hypothetical protein SVTN_01090 [Streptomyces vietnamensis]
MLNLSAAEARAWAMSGTHARNTAGPDLQKPAAPADDLLADAWNTMEHQRPAAPALAHRRTGPGQGLPRRCLGPRTGGEVLLFAQGGCLSWEVCSWSDDIGVTPVTAQRSLRT